MGFIAQRGLTQENTSWPAISCAEHPDYPGFDVTGRNVPFSNSYYDLKICCRKSWPMVSSLYGDYNQMDPLNWRIAVGQSIDDRALQNHEADFARAMVQAPEEVFPGGENGSGGQRDKNAGMQPEPDATHGDGGAQWAAQAKPFFDADAARTQFNAYAAANGYRPARGAPGFAERGRSGVTLRKDAVDVDFEEIVDDDDLSPGLRRIGGGRPRPAPRPTPGKPLRLGYGGGVTGRAVSR